MAIYKLQGIALLLRRYRSPLLLSPRRFDETRSSLFDDKSRYNYSSRIQGRMLGNTPSSITNVSRQPPPSPSPKPRIPVWLRWVVGSVFSLVLSLWMPKWSTLLRLGGEAEVVMKEIEQAVEVVEKVATVAEKVAEDVADELPDQNKLKEVAMVVEKISKETAKDAHIADQIIHKVDSVKQDLEDLEILAEPLIDKIIHDKKPQHLLQH